MSGDARHLEKNAPQSLFPRIDDRFWSYFAGPYQAMKEQFEKMGS